MNSGSTVSSNVTSCSDLIHLMLIGHLSSSVRIDDTSCKIQQCTNAVLHRSASRDNALLVRGFVK